MGTNYYALPPRKRKTRSPSEEGYHIGKSSGGWQFTFRGYVTARDPIEEDLVLAMEPGLPTSVAEWREFLKKRTIFDEYGRKIPYNDFWKMVEESKISHVRKYEGKPALNHFHESEKGFPAYTDYEKMVDKELGRKGMTRSRRDPHTYLDKESGYAFIDGWFS